MASVKILLSGIQAFLLLHIAVADPILDVHPKVIDRCLSQDLETNCSFSTINHPNMAALISLTLFRSNDSGPNYSELAVVTEYSVQANLQINENATAVGLISPGGESYLSLDWEYPSEIQSGYYMCSAKGFDFTGHIIEETAVAQVTWNQPEIQALTDKIAEMDNYIKELEQRLADVQTANFMSPLTYMNRMYYVSIQSTGSIQEALAVCKLLGGYLAEIDNANEDQALQAYLDTLGTFRYVYVAGTDAAHEGIWLFQSNQQPLQYLNWSPGEPRDGTVHNCLCLDRTVGWKMVDCICADWPVNALCEVPQL